MSLRSAFVVSVLFASASALTGCGSDGEATTTISGSVFASAVDSASLSVTDTSGNIVAGPVTTIAGGYSIAIPDVHLSNELVFSASGGSFTDEATQQSTIAGELAAHVQAGSLVAGSEVHLTPASSMIRHMTAMHQMSLVEAQEAFSAAFGYIPDTSIAPTDATAPAADAEVEQLLAGLRAAVFSQLAQDLGLTAAEQFELVTALADDLADGALDGTSTTGSVMVGDTALPEDTHSRVVMALINFRNSGNDNTGLNSAQIGPIPLARVFLTDTYRVEYIPGDMEPINGKTVFTLNIRDRSSGDAVTMLSPEVMPVMYMGSGDNHSTPVGGASHQGQGEYEVTLYYVMPTMMGGETLGYWDLKLMLNGEEAHFFPTVMMATGDTMQTRLKGRDPDQILNMDGILEGRTYFLFRDGLSGTGNKNMDFFIAAKDSMMSFPAVYTGQALNAGASAVTDVLVEVSTDGSSFSAATDAGSGKYSASGLSVIDRVYVRLSVDIDAGGLQQKTTDGMLPDGAADIFLTNEFTTFLVTP